MTYVSRQALASMSRPDFLVDVVIRSPRGELRLVCEGLDWDDAVARALSAVDDGLQAEIGESDYEEN